MLHFYHWNDDKVKGDYVIALKRGLKGVAVSCMQPSPSFEHLLEVVPEDQQMLLFEEEKRRFKKSAGFKMLKEMSRQDLDVYCVCNCSDAQRCYRKVLYEAMLDEDCEAHLK